VLVLHAWNALEFPMMCLDVYLLVALGVSSYLSCAAVMRQPPALRTTTRGRINEGVLWKCFQLGEMQRLSTENFEEPDDDHRIGRNM
jgi:hypothetical protein